MEAPINNKHPGGRPRTYKTAEELEAVIDEYFNSKMHPIITKQGEIAKDLNGDIIYVYGSPPTTTGLAYYLGFKSRQALINYQGRDEFHDAITRAKMRIMEYGEERLYDRDGVQGAKFALSNNNPEEGWVEKQTIEHTGTTTALTGEDAAKLMSAMAQALLQVSSIRQQLQPPTIDAKFEVIQPAIQPDAEK